MATSLGSLTLKMILDLVGYTGPLEKTSEKTKKHTRGMQKQFDDLGKTIKGIAVAAGAGLIFDKIITNTIEAEKAASQLNAVLTATGRFTPELSKQMLEYSSALQQVSIFGDEAITASQTILAGFTSIGGPVFQRAQESILDIASKLGKDLPEAARTVGLALEDPIKGVRLLRSLNVILSQSQIDLIKSFEAVGDRASAQGVILSALESSSKGAAAAARDTLGGALTSLSNTFGDLLEGDASGPGGLAAAVNDLNATLNDPGVKSGIASIVAGMLDIASAAASAIAALTNVSKFLLDEQRASVFGPQLDDLVRLDEQAANARATLETLQKAAAGNPGDRTFIESLSKATADLAEKEQMLAAGRAAAEKRLSAVGGGKPPSIAAVVDTSAVKASAAALDVQRKASDDAAKSAQALFDKNQSAVAALQLQAEVIGKSADEVTLYKLALDGATTTQQAQAKAALESVAAYEQQQQAIEDAAGKQAEIAALYQSNIELITGLESESQSYGKTLEELNTLLDSGAISQADYTAAVDRLGESLDKVPEKVDEAGKQMQQFADQAARNIQDSLADFLFDPFSDGLDGMVKDFAVMLQKLINQAIAADILNAIGIGGQGNTGGNLAALAGGIGGLFGGLFGGAHAKGGIIPAGKFGLVGENGPELITGSGGGVNVVPLRMDSPASGRAVGRQSTVIQNINVQGRVDSRTANQMANDAARKQSMAQSRLG